MSGFRIEGNTSGNVAEVDSSNHLRTTLANTDQPTSVGSVRIISENDAGAITGTPYLLAPETTNDYRLRVGVDTILWSDTFNYAAQNTANYVYRTSTLTSAWSGGYITHNSGSSTSAGQTAVGTYASFLHYGRTSLYCEVSFAITATPPSNWQWDVGLFAHNTTAPFAPSDGVYMRLTSAGIIGCVNYNGSEVTTGTLYSAGSLSLNTNYVITVSITDTDVKFWLDDQYLGQLDVPAGNPSPCSSQATPFSSRLTQPAVAGAVCQVKLGEVNITQGEIDINCPAPIQQGLAGLFAYQGASGGTMGSTANYANSANPTAAVPTNTTAALGTGLGGQFWETDTLAVTTDGIISSYQNPAGSATQTARNLVITGVTISSHIQTALTGGGYVASWCLAFGHTAVSLATTEAATTKIPRRIPIGFQTVASGATALTLLNTMSIDLSSAPIVLRPGEFIATVKKKIGTAPSAGVVAHLITFTGYYL